MSDESSSIATRKQDHLRIVLKESVGATGVTTSFERNRFCHFVLAGMLPRT